MPINIVEDDEKVTINLYRILSTSEEEEWVFYYTGDKSAEEFNKDVREALIEVLNRTHAFEEVEPGVFVKKRAMDRIDEIRKLVNCLREKYGKKPVIMADAIPDGGHIRFFIDSEDIDIFTDWEKECGVNAFFNEFLAIVHPHEVFESEEFNKAMLKRGWKRVEFEVNGSVWFYEWGGFVQDKNGEWFNNVWNDCYRSVRTGERVCPDKEEGDDKDE